MKRKIAVIWISSMMLLGLIVIVIENVPVVEAPATIYVDDVPGEGPGNPKENYTSIQAAIDNASEGDTVFVYNGTYYETLHVNKSINLEGENKSRVIIDGQKSEATLFIRDTINVSVNDFSIHNGSYFDGSLCIDNASCDISNCNINGSKGYDDPSFAGPGSMAISSYDSTITVINSSIYGGRGGDYEIDNPFSMGGDGGEGVNLYNSDAMITESIIRGGSGGFYKYGDFLFPGVGIGGDGNHAIILGESELSIFYCNVRSGAGRQSGNFYTQAGNCIHGTNSNLTASHNYLRAGGAETGNAIYIYNYGSIDKEVSILNNMIQSSEVGINLIGVSNSTIERNTIDKCDTAFKVQYCSPEIVNTTILWYTVLSLNFIAFDVGIDSHPIALNTTYDEDHGDIQISSGLNLTIAWFVNVEVRNLADEPIKDAIININDTYGLNEATRITDNQGCVKWIPIRERVITSSSIINYTPHYMSAIKDMMFGDIFPNQTINKNRNFIIVLNFTSFYQDVKHGWNLVSIPLFILNKSLPGIFSRNKGQYNAVQYYNTTDTVDQWKHYQISKPPHLNDLDSINQRIGFWIYITEQGGTHLVVLGNKPIQNQSITLHPGWNMVGYPSLSNKNRTAGLNNLTFDSDINAIWSYDAASQKWEEMGESDCFEVGKGYFIHSKVEKTWEVPL